jgi:hypothetical protein
VCDLSCCNERVVHGANLPEIKAAFFNKLIEAEHFLQWVSKHDIAKIGVKTNLIALATIRYTKHKTIFEYTTREAYVEKGLSCCGGCFTGFRRFFSLAKDLQPTLFAVCLVGVILYRFQKIFSLAKDFQPTLFVVYLVGVVLYLSSKIEDFA